MRTRIYLISVLLVSALLLAVLWLTRAGTVEVKAYCGCENPYVVQRGDTLYSIARRFGTTVPTLVRLNGIYNPHRIYAGQVLCLPARAAPAPTPAPTPAPPKVALEATYVFTATAEETEWPLSQTGEVGKRVVYPLAGINAFQTLTDTTDLLAAINDGDLPVLWVSGTGGATPGYVLVSVGEGEFLSTLRISDTSVITPFVPSPTGLRCPREPIEIIADLKMTAIDLTLWLESAGGVRYPFPIAEIAHADDVEQIERCFRTGAVFALLPPVSLEGDGYRAVMVLSHSIDGPPGVGWSAKCGSWRGGGGFYRWLRAWYGCP